MSTQNLFASLLGDAWQNYHSGNLVRARELCNRLLMANRGLPQAINLSAFIDYQSGRPDLAVAQLRAAIQQSPTNAGFHNNLGMLFSYSRQPEEAVACYRQALRLLPDCASTWNNLSGALLDLGLVGEALTASDEALRFRPDFAEAHNNRGLVLLELGRPEEAAEQFQKALRLQPLMVEAHRNLGKALVDLDKFDQAAASFARALKLRPDFAEVHADLAEVRKQQGRFRDAVDGLLQSLHFKPNYAFATWVLSQFAQQGQYDFPDEQLDQIGTLSRDNSQSLVDRSLFHMTLGDVLDRREAYDAAFSHYRQGSALRREWLGQIGKAFDIAAHRRVVENTMATCDEAFFRQIHPAGSDSEVPVFVVGMPRSGTTLVTQILSSHSQVVGAGELPDMEQLANDLELQKERLGGYPACLRSLRQAEVGGLAGRYLQRLARIGGSARRVVDKLPGNFMYLGLIALLFPRARIIHCRRDPLDVCLSCYFQNFHRVNFSWSLEDLGQYHHEYERLMAHWQRVLPLRILNVSYEDLVARQDAVSREMVGFCGLDWEDCCLAFHKNPQPVKTASVLQVRKPMYATSIGRWKHYAAHLEPLRQALGSVSSALPPSSDLGAAAFAFDQNLDLGQTDPR